MRLLLAVAAVLASVLPTAAWARGPIVSGSGGLWDILVALGRSLSH